MVSLRFTSLLILAPFFLLHALRSSLAHAHQVKGGDSFGLQQNHTYTRKGLVDGIRVEVTRKRGFEGRKIITDHDLMGEAHPQMKHQSDATSMLPGNHEVVLKKPLKKSWQNKVDIDKAEPKTSNLKASKKAIQELNNADVKNKVERLLKSTEEMVSLMHGDYGTLKKPKRKPPINNQGPKD